MKFRSGYGLLIVAVIAALFAGDFWRQAGDPGWQATPGTA